MLTMPFIFLSISRKSSKINQHLYFLKSKSVHKILNNKQNHVSRRQEGSPAANVKIQLTQSGAETPPTTFVHSRGSLLLLNRVAFQFTLKIAAKSRKPVIGMD